MAKRSAASRCGELGRSSSRVSGVALGAGTCSMQPNLRTSPTPLGDGGISYDSAWPALGVYAESIGQGLTYTPARLITVYSALDRYAKTQHSTANLKVLRTYSGVPSSVTGQPTRGSGCLKPRGVTGPISTNPRCSLGTKSLLTEPPSSKSCSPASELRVPSYRHVFFETLGLAPRKRKKS